MFLPLRSSLTAAFLLFVLLFSSCGPRTEQELYDAATGAQRLGQYDEAIGYFESFLEEYPASTRLPDVRYALGVMYQDRKGDFRRAIAMYELIIKESPGHPTASSAMFMVGFIHHNELNDLDAARTAYERFLASYPESPLAASARFELDNLGKDPADIFTEEHAARRKP